MIRIILQKNDVIFIRLISAEHLHGNIIIQSKRKIMTYTNSYYMVNKHQQLIKIVNFYEKQIEVLDNMLEEITARYKTATSFSEKEHFHKRFVEKQKLINELKNEINSNNYLLTNDIVQNQGRLTDKFVNQNKQIEEEVVLFEKEVNELSKDFKMYLLEKL